MKRNTSNSIKKAFSYLGLPVLFVFVTTLVQGQVTQNGILYVDKNTSIFLSSQVSSFTFGASPATTKTDRTDSTYGKIIYGNSVNPAGTSDDHYNDGYVSTLSTGSFVFPVGQSGVYAPLKVESISNNVYGIDAAYFNSPPTVIGSTMASSIIAISSKEYWTAKSAGSAIISLSWRTNSDIGTLTNSELANLIIAGWNGSSWVEIPVSAPGNSFVSGTSSSLTQGSISSSSVVDLSLYSAFTLATKTNCSTLITSNGQVKTWDGSNWSPSGNPTSANPVVINGDYHAGSFECNSLELNADITLADNEVLKIENGVTTTTGKKIIMASSSSVFQKNGSAPGPNILINLKTRKLSKGDYTYFGTPINGNFFSQLSNAQAVSGTLKGALDGFYTWDTSKPLQPSNNFSYWYSLTATSVGKGFIARIKQQAPFINSTATDFVNVPLTGIANNGDITVPIYRPNSTVLDAQENFNLLGNPYPSAIDANKFLEENLDIDGVVYVWKAQTKAAGASQSYSQADYITYTKAGSTSPDGSNTFDGKIASGQGFMIKALTNNSTALFNNCMRLTTTNSNSYFSKKSQTSSTPIDRFKLNLTNSSNVFSQILIAYLPNGTLDYDRLYDASRNSTSTTQLYSLLDKDGRQLAINARPSFFPSDVVQLGIKKSETVDQNFSINIVEQEGVFAEGKVSVFLYDKLLQVYQDLANGPYTFTTNKTSLNDRFEIVYQNKTLSNPDFDINNFIFAKIDNGILSITSSSEMNLVEVFDINGRKIKTIKANNSKNISEAFNYPDGVYIAKIKLENGVIESRKLINFIVRNH